MQLITLTKGIVTTVDDEDYEMLSKFNWYAQGNEFRPARRITQPRRTIIYMYHQILKVWPWVLKENGMVVDHLDRDPLNNQKENLRIVTQLENMQNSRRSVNRTGVSRDNRHNRWKAYIDEPNKLRRNIGTFKTYEEAERAVTEARRRNIL